jgi:hypothetical protein
MCLLFLYLLESHCSGIASFQCYWQMAPCAELDQLRTCDDQLMMARKLRKTSKRQEEEVILRIPSSKVVQ